MIYQLSKKLSLLLLLFFAVTLSVEAQSSRFKSPVKTQSGAKVKQDVAQKRISDKDRKAIQSLFRGVAPDKYRLQFYNGERRRASKYGRLSYKMNDLKRVQRLTNPVNAAGWIVFVIEGDDVVYVLAVGSDKLKSVLGAQKAKRLNSIMAKYK